MVEQQLMSRTLFGSDIAVVLINKVEIQVEEAKAYFPACDLDR